MDGRVQTPADEHRSQLIDIADSSFCLLVMQPSSRECEFCSQNPAKYTCPRCRRSYCSSVCYASKEHDSCAQIFYRKCVIDQRKSDAADAGIKNDMIDILKRMAEPDPGADCSLGQDDFVARFEGMDFSDESAEGTAKLLSRLTEDERRDFENMIINGHIVRLIPEEEKSDPWWISFHAKLVIDDADTQSSGLGHKRDLVNRLPLLSSLSRAEPSPHLKYCIMNLIISYCYTYRLFGGDVLSCANDFLEELRVCSIVVRDAFVFHDTATALHHCTQNLIREQHVSVAFVRLLFEDSKLIVSNKDAVLELLSDVWFVVQKCLTHDGKTLKREKLLLKKVEYLIAWTKERSDELNPLAYEVDLLIARMAAEMAA